MGTLTLSRFFVLHVFLIPAAIFAVIAAHLFLFRKAGAAGPPLSPEKLRVLEVRPFFPDQVVKDFVFGILLILLLGVLSALFPTRLGPVANPTDSTYVPRPEWYYLPAFQWLKYWRGGGILVGIVLIPAILFAMLFGIPFLDRSRRRAPLQRPVAVGGFFLVVGGLIFLGYQSSAEDRKDPAVRAKIAAQEDAEREYTKAPFEADEGPLALGARNGPAPQNLTPEAAKGALLFESEGCSSCHGAGGGGGEGLVKLWGMKDRYSDRQLADLMRSPRPAMLEGGMEASKLPDADLRALVAYVRATMNGKK
jgi:ubiquinol-cytochrome c reductase cytochrome b subunit